MSISCIEYFLTKISDLIFTKEVIGAFIGTIIPLFFVFAKDYYRQKKLEKYYNSYCKKSLDFILLNIDDIHQDLILNNSFDMFESTAAKIKLLYSNIKNQSLYFERCTDFELKNIFDLILLKTPNLIFPYGDYINRNSGVEYKKMREHFEKNFKK